MCYFCSSETAVSETAVSELAIKIKNILIEEFGKDYGIYFSILSAIAREKTLEAKANVFLRVTGELKGYSLSYKGLSMEDM